MQTTTIIFVGDNGTQRPATQPPFDPDHGKGTLFEGGVHVPLIISGAGVTARGEQSPALVNTTDLFATVSELMGVDARAVVGDDIRLDSRSLVPLLAAPWGVGGRRYLFAERFAPNHSDTPDMDRRAVRGRRYKLFSNAINGKEHLYDLLRDPFEEQDLLLGSLDAPQSAALEELRSALLRIRGS